MTTHLMIPDPQAAQDTPVKHFKSLGRFIQEFRPDKIICIGDLYDFPSLSSYASRLEADGRRYQIDVDAGNRTIDFINEAVAGTRAYNPELHFCYGNHEMRVMRMLGLHPELEGKMGFNDLTSIAHWTQHAFLDLAKIDGVNYTHYLAANMTGRPLGGNCLNKLNKEPFSFSMGHVQTFDYAVKFTKDKRRLHGLVAGAFYLHDEAYKRQANYHWRGVVWKDNVKNGDYDINPIHIDRIMRF